MAEISNTSSIASWPKSNIVKSINDAGQSPKRQMKHQPNNDEEKKKLKKNIKKKRPPGSNMNPHIDEYA